MHFWGTIIFLFNVVYISALTRYGHGGGSCSTDWDCSLGGLCNNGVCECDVWFTGQNCALLNLARAAPANGLNISGWSTWGGHAVHGDKDGGNNEFKKFMKLHLAPGAAQVALGDTKNV